LRRIIAKGANERSREGLSSVEKGEYVVDVNNKIVMQIFKF
jgi:hypothetical protein